MSSYPDLSSPVSASYNELHSPSAASSSSHDEKSEPTFVSSNEEQYAEAPSSLPRGYGPAANRVGKDAYTWDICLVFAVGDPQKDVVVRTKVDKKVQKSKKKEQEVFSERAAAIIKAVKQADLKYCLYKNVQEDQVFMLVAATEQRLKVEADRVDYDLELDAHNTLKLGIERKLKLATMTADEGDERYAQFKKEQWEGLFGPYKLPDGKNPKRDELYRHFEKEDGTTSPFRPADRIKLTINILEADEKQHGAGLTAAKFIKANDHPLVAFFPLHDLPTRAKIWEECSLWHAVFHIPVGPIRKYFGEQIGFYFAFLQFYSAALLVPAICGVAFFIWQAVTEKIDIAGLPAFALLVSIWATLFLELWKRKESIYKYKWGMAKFTEKEEPRPQFHGTWVPSPVDGRLVEAFPTYQKVLRVFMGQSIAVFCALLATAAAGGLLYARSVWILLSPGNRLQLQVAAAVLNALQVQIGNILYKRIAAWLNEWENYRTETEYENALIFKAFMFEWVNSYATLIYIAFFKRIDKSTGCPGEEFCMDELRVQLGMVFVTQLVVSNFIELAKPLWSTCRAAKKLASLDVDKQLSGPEEEYALEKYESPFGDFDEIVIQYGYATLFVVALPLTPLLYLINNVAELYLDSYKLCKLTRRPEPRGAANIGTWQSMLKLQGYLAVVSNCALITLVANRSVGLQSDTLSPSSKAIFSLVAFILSEHLLIAFKQALSAFVPDVPESILVRQRRQEYIVNALIWEMDVEEIHEEDIDRINNPEENIRDKIVDHVQDVEASTRNVLEHYQLDRIPTTFKMGMAAVSGKDAYGEIKDDGSHV